jgi:uncharacterized protein
LAELAEVDPYPRFAESGLREALAESPVVLLHGPRQSGKTTLAQDVGRRLGYAYFTFDSDVTRAAAEADPAGFVDGLPAHVILDEVQRVPELFTSLKLAVDRDRRPGRFLLTGSSNVLLLPRLADSLAGRMDVLRLHPLAQCEIARRKPQFLSTLFDARFKVRPAERLGDALFERIAAGGYPPALARRTSRSRASWYQGYIESLVQRDVRELARISALDAMPRLLAIAASQTARLFNRSELAAPLQLSRPTVRDYVTLLERVFMLETLPPWHTNRLSRLVKTPKLHLADTGLACALLGATAAALKDDRDLLGQLLETFVFQELRRQGTWLDDPASFFHFRDKDGYEVDIVVECGRKLAGVEVKAGATVREADFRGLRKLRDGAGSRFAAGAILYDGGATASFGGGMFAVPIRALWET